jgi:hypothetical protein
MATDRNPQKLVIRGVKSMTTAVADILIEGGNIVAVGLNLPATLSPGAQVSRR